MKKTLQLNFFYIFYILVFSMVCFVCDASYDVKFFKTRDGKSLRYLYAPTKNSHKGTIFILQGRGSFIEKHKELMEDFNRKGYHVWNLDLRGQGGSQKVVKHSQKVHIDSFEFYLNDIKDFVEVKIKPTQENNFFIYGSSLGGHLAVRYLEEISKNHNIRGAILVSPMFEVSTFNIPKFIVRTFIKVMSLLGFQESYAPFYGDYVPSKDYFREDNSSTHDKKRFERQMQICKDHMNLVTGGPTIGWVEAMFESLDTLREEKYLKHIDIPILLLNGGLDSVFENVSDFQICNVISQCELVKIPEARHNIVMEIDSIRNKFWYHFDKFVDSLRE